MNGLDALVALNGLDARHEGELHQPPSASTDWLEVDFSLSPLGARSFRDATCNYALKPDIY